eukprot:Tbor_TRINITY_DN4682_c0_g1::TRINITY_DN4682_c0_g1_i1::g.14973::m.14973
MEHKNYTTQIDVWGIGCVMGELLGSKPLCPGKDRVNQLDRIIDLVGTPSEAVLSTIGSKSAQKYLRKKGNQPPLDLATKYPKAHPAALDLLQRMLAFHLYRQTTFPCCAHKEIAAMWCDVWVSVG